MSRTSMSRTDVVFLDLVLDLVFDLVLDIENVVVLEVKDLVHVLVFDIEDVVLDVEDEVEDN